MKKLKKPGTCLTRKEMKAIKGGGIVPMAYACDPTRCDKNCFEIQNCTYGFCENGHCYCYGCR